MISLLDISFEKIENISKITLDDLRNPEIFGRLEELAKEAYTYGFLKEANYLLWELILLSGRYPRLAQSDPKLYTNYQKLIAYLEFVALISQPINEVENLLRQRLLLAIREEIDLKTRFRLIFLTNADDETGDKIRRAIIKAMEANEEKIGKENLAGAVGGSPVYPYIKNWLRNYIAFFPVGKETRGELEQATYLNQNKDVRKLNQEEKKVLTGIIQLYDYLHFPSEEKTEVKATGHTPRIIPGQFKAEEINKTGNFAKPAIEVSQIKKAVADQPNNDLAELQKLAASFPPGSFERKAVEEEIERIKSE